MTYNEFMSKYNAYKEFLIKTEIGKYGCREAASKIGCSASTISRLQNGKCVKGGDNLISKLIGKDIRDVEVKDMKQAEIEYLENRLAELKADQSESGNVVEY